MLDITELTAPEYCHISSLDVRAITPHIIAATFEEILHKKCVWEQFYRDNTDILNKPGKNVVFPGAAAANAFTIGLPECVDITAYNTVGLDNYTATTISIEKIGGFFSVSREAIKFAMRDVLKDNLYETGLQYKTAIDGAAYNMLMFGTHTKPAAVSNTSIPIGDTYATIGVNAIEITFTGDHTGKFKDSISAVDYCGGTVFLKGTLGTNSSTISYLVGSKPGLCVSAARPGSTATGVTPWGILEAKAKMIAEGRDPDVVVMSYNDLPNLLYDEKVNFLDASAYTSHEPLYNAEVGRLWGLKVITESRQLPQGCAIVIDVDRMGYDVHKENLTSYREDVYKRDAIYYYFYAERGFGVTDTLALCKVVGGTPDYPATHPVN